MHAYYTLPSAAISVAMRFSGLHGIKLTMNTAYKPEG